MDIDQGAGAPQSTHVHDRGDLIAPAAPTAPTAPAAPATSAAPAAATAPIDAAVKSVDGPSSPQNDANSPSPATPADDRGNNTKQTSTSEDISKDGNKSDDGEGDDDPEDLASLNAYEYSRVQQYDEEALRRYEQYRRSDLKTAKIKKLLVTLNPSMQKASEQYIIAVKGLAKMFVGDVTETALIVQKERGDEGPLEPAHLREAYRRLRLSGAFPSTVQPPVSFMST